MTEREQHLEKLANRACEIAENIVKQRDYVVRILRLVCRELEYRHHNESHKCKEPCNCCHVINLAKEAVAKCEEAKP